MTNRRQRAIGCLAALFVIATIAEGQVAKPGDRVRVIQVQGTKTLVLGTLVRLTADSATIVSDSVGPTDDQWQHTVSLARENRLERSMGMQRQTFTGMGFGLVVGATTGALLGALMYQKPDCGQSIICLDYGRQFSAMGGAIVVGSLGTLLGGITGANRRHEVWSRVGTIPQRISVIPTAGKGLMLSAHASF